MKTIYFGVSYDFFADLASEQALIFLAIDFDLILISLCYFFSLCYIWMAFNISFSTPLWLFFSFFFFFLLDPFDSWWVERHTTQAEAAAQQACYRPQSSTCLYF